MLWILLSFAVVAGSPLGRALADRISGRVRNDGDDLDEIGWMEERVEARIADLDDRIEFAERLLARPNDVTEASG